MTAAEQQERRDRAAALIEALIPKPPAAHTPVVAAPAPRPKQAVEQGEGPASQEAKSPPTRTVRPGDLVCRRCGEVSDGDRRFCRRCGHSLVDAERFQPDEASTEPRPGRTGLPVRRVGGPLWRLTAILAVVGLASLALPDIRGAVFPLAIRSYCAARFQLFPELDGVSALRVRAQGLGGHGAGKLIDGNIETHWAESGPRQGTGQTITMFLDEPTDIAQMVFSTGRFEDFEEQPRPAQITVRLLNAQGSLVSEEEVYLLDMRNRQPVEVSGAATQTIQLRIDSVYEGQAGHALAIREIELLAKRC